MSAAPPPTRVFVVGSPRSGTTIVQRLAAERFRLHTRPETHLVPRIRRDSRVLHRLGWARADGLERAGDCLGCRLPPQPWPARTRLVPIIAAAVAHLDAEAAAAGREGWVEKTPAHLRSVSLITRACQPLFLHVLRDGAAVTASVAAVTALDPEPWGGVRRPVDAAARWADDMARHARWAGTPGHAFVRYEDLVADPDAVVTAAGSQLGLVDHGEDDARRPDLAVALAVAVERWKVDTTGPITAERAGRLGAEARRLEEDPAVAARLRAGRAALDRIPVTRPGAAHRP